MAEFAALLKEYGGWGLSAILMAVIVRLYADNKALSTGYIERLIGAVEAAKDASEGMRVALSELRSLLAENRGTVGDLGHQISILVEKVQHGFGNTNAALEGFTRLLERERERREDRERQQDRDRGRP